MKILVQIGPLVRPGRVLKESKKKKEKKARKETFSGAVFPLTLTSGLYNSLYYRTSRDTEREINVVEEVTEMPVEREYITVVNQVMI